MVASRGVLGFLKMSIKRDIITEDMLWCWFTLQLASVSDEIKDVHVDERREWTSYGGLWVGIKDYFQWEGDMKRSTSPSWEKYRGIFE